jgi:hypothetical protein
VADVGGVDPALLALVAARPAVPPAAAVRVAAVLAWTLQALEAGLPLGYATITIAIKAGHVYRPQLSHTRLIGDEGDAAVVPATPPGAGGGLSDAGSGGNTPLGPA